MNSRVVYRSGSLQPQLLPSGSTAVSGGRFAALQNLSSFIVPPFSSPFSWSITGGAEGNNTNANGNDKVETKKEIGLVSRELQLARLRERMAEGGVIIVSRLGKRQEVTVPCMRCVDRIVAP